MLLKKDRSSVEVYNDINGDLVNLMRQVKYHAPELLREMEGTLNSREIFKQFLAQPGITEIQRAARFIMLNKLSFGGLGKSYGTSKTTGGSASNLKNARLRANVEAVSARLDGVNIERDDWRSIITRYDSSGTFFFFDPPYTECSSTTYAPWDFETMGQFRDRLNLIQGTFLVTVNDSEAVREMFSGFEITAISRANGIERRADKIKNLHYKELIIQKPARPIS